MNMNPPLHTSLSASNVFHPEITEQQLITLEHAISSYHMQKVVQKMNQNPHSNHDELFLMELAREGILDQQILKHALMITPGTSYSRNRDLSYLFLTIDRFIQQISKDCIWFDDAQQKLEEEFNQIDLNQDQIILCEAGTGIGKTHNAIRKVKEAVEQNLKVLILVHSHDLATEWESNLKLDDSKSVVRLYGVTHSEVNCPEIDQAKTLMSKGNSTLFRKKYCASCQLQEDCKYYQNQNSARDADVLIALHQHLKTSPEFLQKEDHGNYNRSLVVIDEMPELIKLETIGAEDLDKNLKLFLQMRHKEQGLQFRTLAKILIQLLRSHKSRVDITLADYWLEELANLNLGYLNQLIAKHHLRTGSRPKHKNLLWDLKKIQTLKPELKYVLDQDILTYRWTPDFSQKTTLILSATLTAEYLRLQIEKPVKAIAQNWKIIRKNLKVVQLAETKEIISKKSILKDIRRGEFANKHGRCFDLMLQTHPDQTIAIFTSLGEKDSLGKTKTFKSIIKNELQPIAVAHHRKLESVDNLTTCQIPDDQSEWEKSESRFNIPIFHYGLKGVDKLKGKFTVTWEVNGYSLGDEGILNKLHTKFHLEEDQIGESRPGYIELEDFFGQQKSKTKSIVWNHPLAKMEQQHSEVKEMEQAEGRVLREDQKAKIIYRTHNVPMTPNPTRICSNWKKMFEQEFNDFVEPNDLLTEKETEIFNWIRENKTDQEFKVKDVAEGLRMDVDNMRKDLKRLVGLGVLEIWKVGRINFYQLNLTN